MQTSNDIIKKNLEDKGLTKVADYINSNLKVISYKKLIDTYNIDILANTAKGDLLDDDVSTFDTFYNVFVSPVDNYLVDINKSGSSMSLSQINNGLSRFYLKHQGIGVFSELLNSINIDELILELLKNSSLDVFAVKMDPDNTRSLIKLIFYFKSELPKESDVDELTNLLDTDPSKLLLEENQLKIEGIKKAIKENNSYLSTLNQYYCTRALYDPDALRFENYYNKIIKMA